MHFSAHLIPVMSSMRFLVQPQSLPSLSRHSTHRVRSRTLQSSGPPKYLFLPMTRQLIVSLLFVVIILLQEKSSKITCLELTHLKEQQEYFNLNDSTSISTIEQQESYSSDLSATTKSEDELYSSGSSNNLNNGGKDSTQSEPIRPFYNIAHMVNSIREIKYYISKGANAVEADVTFSPNGTALYTFHGYPCDCFRHCTEREDIIDYLKYVRSITLPESPNYKPGFALMFFDLKLNSVTAGDKGNAGKDMATKVIDHLFQDNNGGPYSKINVLMSIPYTHDSDFVLGFMDEIQRRNLPSGVASRIGWDVGMNDPVNKIITMWKRLEIINNIWQGDGRTNCLSPFLNMNRLNQIIATRDNGEYVDKVYHWTIDLTASLRYSLRAGVDGIITNHPERLVNVLKEPEFSIRLKMANQSDSPWTTVKQGPMPLSVSIAQSSRWVSDISDKANSIYEYLKEFIYLRSLKN